MLHEAYIYPFFVVAGVLANSFIVVAFSFPAARRCGRTTRIYYVLIALSDTVRLIEWDLGVNYIVRARLFFYFCLCSQPDWTVL